MANYTIRTAVPSDAEQIMRLRKRVDKEADNKNPPLDPYGGEYPTVEQQLSEIEEYTLTGAFFVALSGAQVIGIAFCFQIYGQPAEYRLKFMVDREWRGRGIGTELITNVLEWAKSHLAVRKMICSFHASYTQVKHVLEKPGFVVGNEGYVYYTQGARYYETEMILDLRSST